MDFKNKKKRAVLLLCNIFLILAMIISVWIYSGYISKSQSEIKRTDFIRTIESMKRVSQNYLNEEKGYVKDWAAYISEHDMTMEEALDFLRSFNTNEERFVHIIDMDSYEAYSAYYPKGEEQGTGLKSLVNIVCRRPSPGRSASMRSQNFIEYIRGYNFQDDYNEGTITFAMQEEWYSCVNKYIAGDCADEKEAAADFVELCSK